MQNQNNHQFSQGFHQSNTMNDYPPMDNYYQQLPNINDQIPFHNNYQYYHQEQNNFPHFPQYYNQLWEVGSSSSSTTFDFNDFLFCDEIDGRRRFRISEILPGYRFQPSPEKLLRDYLIPKNADTMNPLYQHLMPIVDVYGQAPSELIHGYEQLDPSKEEWYFMTKRSSKYPKGTRPGRKAGDGYWKMSGQEKPITYNEIQIGAYTVLDYLIGKHPNGKPSGWKMYEYVVKERDTKAKLEDWVICKVYKFERKENKTSEAEAEPQPANNPTATGHNPNDVPVISPDLSDYFFPNIDVDGSIHPYQSSDANGVMYLNSDEGSMGQNNQDFI